MKDNPFLKEEEEKVYVPKPYQEWILTDKQKTSILKGIKKCIEDLKKIVPYRRRP